MGTINGHVTRISMDASSYDEICVNCGAHDEVPGGLGGLARPCPYAPAEGRPNIICPRCGWVSYHPKDISERYCGNCHQFHDDMRRTVEDPELGERYPMEGEPFRRDEK